MKILLFIPILGVALFASSCRTVTPVDPMTMKQTTRCLPENFPPGHQYHSGHVCGTK